MNEWNRNAKAVQDYHRDQDRPFVGWRRNKSLARNLVVMTFFAIPFLAIVCWGSNR